MSPRPRHRWERLAEHHYRCTVCGCLKANEARPTGSHPDSPLQWVAVFTWGAQRREGLTPPCPGHPAGSPAPAAAPAQPDLFAAPSPDPAPPPAPSTAAPSAVGADVVPPRPGLRPVRKFLPLLAGPPDSTADAYRAWLTQPRPVRGGCGTCRHWGTGDRCAHPVHRGAKPAAEAARAGAGWPLAAPGQVTVALRPYASLADGRYQEGGACGPSAKLWEGR